MKIKFFSFLKTTLMLLGGFVLFLSLCNIFGLYGVNNTASWQQIYRMLFVAVFFSAAHSVISSEALMLKLNRMVRMLLSGLLALLGIGIFAYEFGLQHITRPLLEGMNVGIASTIYIASFLFSVISIFLFCYAIERKYVREDGQYATALSKYKENQAHVLSVRRKMANEITSEKTGVSS